MMFDKVTKNLNFRQQLAVIFSAGILILALITSIVISNISRNAMEKRIISDAISLTQTFGDQSTLALLYRSAETAADTAEVFMAYPDVVGVEIYNSDLTLLYHQGIGSVMGALIYDPTDVAQLHLQTLKHWETLAPIFTTEEQESLDFETIDDGVPFQPELLGYVRVIISKSTLNNLANNILWTNLIASIVMAAALLLILLSITHRVSIPLTHLAKSMKKAQKGNTKERATIDGPTDIRLMISTYNNMMDVLENREIELKDARDDAFALAKTKGEFAANVSHELRTPMNGVLGMLELLSNHELNEEQTEYVSIAKGSAQSLLSLIDEVLQFSKNNDASTKAEYKPFDLLELLNNIISLLSTRAIEKNLEIAYVIEPKVPTLLMGDPDRIRQVVTNLVGNAIKFTYGGRVSLEVCAAETLENRTSLRFEVKDTGIGISESQRNRIFEAFSQADESTTREFGGTGLGLAISKQLVNLMHGDIGVDSSEGNGSIFWFVLPLGEQLSQQRETHIIQKNLRVLVADNSDLTLRSMYGFCFIESISCSICNSYETVIKQLKQAYWDERPFDVIFLDTKLGRSYTGKIIDFIRTMPEFKNIHIILLNQPSQAISKDDEMQVNTVLSKPVQHYHIVNTLNKIYEKNPIPNKPAVDEKPEKCSPKRILIVDDNITNQQVARGMLKSLGHHSDFANNGEECLKMESTNEYDLILMDCHMPVMDGHEATKQLRKRECGGKHIPIIAMTANVMEGERERCLDSGMDDYMSKPLKRQKLADTLSSWLHCTVEFIDTKKTKSHTTQDSAGNA